MADAPHFDLPFRLGPSGFVTVEQDSEADIFNCAVAGVSYIKGQRHDEPTFGITDPTFDQIPVSTDRILGEVQQHEPRVSILMEEHPEEMALLHEQILMKATPKQEGET